MTLYQVAFAWLGPLRVLLTTFGLLYFPFFKGALESEPSRAALITFDRDFLKSMVRDVSMRVPPEYSS